MTGLWVRWVQLTLTLGVALAAQSVRAQEAWPPAHEASPAAFQERQCMARGWQRIVMPVGEQRRVLLWKAPPQRAWASGAIIVLHGGGGNHFHWCVANAELVAPQVRFVDAALARGFAVFLLDSSDRVTDNDGRACGKVWDDEVRQRPNLDLPFVHAVLVELIPVLRPLGSRAELFITGLSSGGYMAARAATRFDGLITAFAPVSSGDPYGWHRTCVAGLTPRTRVHGVGIDNETGRRISEPDACTAEAYPNERAWQTMDPAQRPWFRLFHHADDGVHDASCGRKLAVQLRRNGYPEAPAFWLHAGGERSFANHLWQDAYTEPLLDFFASRLGVRRPG